MASKTAHDASIPPEDLEDMLEAVDKTLERLKTLYEQYFLGIQKQAPAFIHSDVERKLRDLAQLQIRNTGLRYRLATTQQKFGAYNAYWRRTLRQIENGTYLRSLSRVGRQAAKSGAEIPEEILAAMPKRMREQVARDREQALAIAGRRKGPAPAEPPMHLENDDEIVAIVSESTELRRQMRKAGGAYVLEEVEPDLELQAFFESVAQEAAPVVPARPTPPPRAGTEPGAAPTPARPVRTPISVPKAIPKAPSQTTRPVPVVPGAAAKTGPVGVESMSGPFPRVPAPPVRATPVPRRADPPAPKPPPGMSEADVNALYAKYVQAKQAIGETVGPGGYGKLLKTIHAQAPKIMEQYKSRGVDFSIVVKDNQVVIRAKPKP